MRRIALLLIAAMLMPMFAVTAQDAEFKPPRKWTFGSMGVALREDLTVYQGGALDADGKQVIKEKDRLLKWDGTELKTLDDFCRCLYATKPGDICEVEISRPVGDTDERETLTVKIKLSDPKQSYKDLYVNRDKRRRDFNWRAQEGVTKGGPLRDKLWPRIQKHKLERAWDDLLAAQERELDLWDSYESTTSCELLLSDPLSAHQWISEVGDGMTATEFQPIPLDGLCRLLDRKPGDVEFPLPQVSKDGDGAPARSEAWGKALAEVLDALDPLAAARKNENFPQVAARVRDFVFAWRGDPAFEKSAQVVQDIRELGIDCVPALQCADVARVRLAGHGRDAWQELSALPAVEAAHPAIEVEGDCRIIVAGGRTIVLGGAKTNRYRITGDAHVDLIVDVGGDDDYVDCGQTTNGGVSIVIDLAGNDHYRATKKWGVAAGVLGTAIIDDRNGNDVYEAPDWGIGACLGGVGLLIDSRGNDRYLGGTNSIGCAAYGVGGVIDLEGNDVYDAHGYSVGCGQPGGVGVVIDRDGDDRYRSNGEEPSGYGTKGEWNGAGIGCGFGWRTLASGGTGLVYDAAGNDIYDAGEFGLACGYFLGIGAVRDRAGDDIYHSSRYGLAAAAHCACGIFMDDSGNDIYEGKTAASIAGVWDIVTGYFYDGAGDDYYHCDGLGLGACAQNGFGIFWDAGGKDTYRGANSSIGNAGRAEYGGGRLAKNFGIFIDSAGEDSYPRDDRKNGLELLEQEYALFVDE
ncbi:MAG: hypothetical protein H6839_04215 [Planctomycetes bacterium]|nr:hypothetical protein [Planctomycetota bacterium]